MSFLRTAYIVQQTFCTPEILWWEPKLDKLIKYVHWFLVTLKYFGDFIYCKMLNKEAYLFSWFPFLFPQKELIEVDSEVVFELAAYILQVSCVDFAVAVVLLKEGNMNVVAIWDSILWQS